MRIPRILCLLLQEIGTKCGVQCDTHPAVVPANTRAQAADPCYNEVRLWHSFPTATPLTARNRPAVPRCLSGCGTAETPSGT